MDSKLELAGVLCWRLWWWRNRVVHGDAEGVGEDLIEWSTHFLEAYKAAQMPVIKQPPLMADTWIAPPPQVIKINFDVGVLEPNKFRVAVVARDAEGRCVWWRIRRLSGQPPVVVGEARAAYDGVLLAMEKGWRSIILEGDNSEIISAIQNRVDDSFLSYEAFTSSIFALLDSFESFSCSFVRRTGNKLAHALAHFPCFLMTVWKPWNFRPFWPL